MYSESSRTKKKTLTWDSSMAQLSPTCSMGFFPAEPTLCIFVLVKLLLFVIYMLFVIIIVSSFFFNSTFQHNSFLAHGNKESA